MLEVRQLRIGLHVQLDLGWMSHPFALSSFRITSQQQVETLHGLGLQHVRVLPKLSDPAALQGLVDDGLCDPAAAGIAPSAATPLHGDTGADGLSDAPATNVVSPREQARAAAQAERRCAQRAERAYNDAGRGLKRSFDTVFQQPTVAREHCETQVHALLDKLLVAEEMSIRLLSESAGDRGSLHAVNVTVLSLLLGRVLGLDKADMFDLGVGAMLHDIGKLELPERLRRLSTTQQHATAAERQLYQDHVALGVGLGRKMQLSPGAMLVVAQHHEHADGSGFPRHVSGDQMSRPARIVALVNRYDNLCNPASPADALTPHEALALMYGQMKHRFDAVSFAAFIKMLGIYPPGSIVQLSDGRYGSVLSVNSERPLKPRVRVHDAGVPRDDALPLDLEQSPGLSIRRSLKPEHLPRATLDYLSPRQRICYFFERARDAEHVAEAALA